MRKDTISFSPYDECVHELFEAQAERAPDAVAVCFEEEQLTYRELNRRANQLAHHLRSLGVGPEVPVGIFMKRSVEMITGLLGILKAGGAYVPLDPTYPRERLTFLLSDSQVRMLLTRQETAGMFPEAGISEICFDTDWEKISREKDGNPSSGVLPENPAYIIYTSGSTGKPKGVVIQHGSLVNLIKAVIAEYDLSDRDRTLQFASVSFDVAAEEICSCLACGATLRLRTDEMLSSLPRFVQKCRDWGLTVLNLPTAYWHPLAYELMKTDLNLPESVRLVVIGGEQASPEHLRMWQNSVGPYPCLINSYGPTETTVGVTCCKLSELPPTDTVQDIPIGRPIPHVQTYVLDRHLHQVPVGVPGELCIGGICLARGYLNRPDLTAEKFIPNPFVEEPGARLYKTGDLVRRLPDGNLEFLGRIDRQVKIRGFRIEPEEIEAVLNRHPAVRESVVAACGDSPHHKRLAAYVVLDTEHDASSNRAGKQQAEQVGQWQMLYDRLYKQLPPTRDSAFNIVGWDSSYTGNPIPEEEMREWIDHTVKRISSLHPKRVLEIGCGTGLVLLRIAPRCTRYWGTDLSETAVHRLKQQLTLPGRELPQVSLFQRTADDFEGIEPNSFDTIILNSVVQYFPDAAYLLRVLKGAMESLAPAGAIFIGDVRSLPLLQAFYASVQLYRASASLSVTQLKKHIHRHREREVELALDPAFFTALKRRFPQISHVEIQLKRGRRHNELTRFRYDVILHIGKNLDSDVIRPREASLSQGSVVRQMDGQSEKLTPESVRRFLTEVKPDVLKVTAIPNARLQSELRMTELLGNPDGPETVGELREMLKNLSPQSGVDPEDLWTLGEELAYDVHIGWSDSGGVGCYDAVFSRKEFREDLSGVPPLLKTPQASFVSWEAYTNKPLQAKRTRELLKELRNYLGAKLPGPMVPSVFVPMDALPRNLSGKTDRNALPPPDLFLPDPEESPVAPRNAIEEIVSDVWREVLRSDRGGIHDNFFEVGGDSLLATQLLSRIYTAFKVELPLQSLFEAPTVAGLGEMLVKLGSLEARRSIQSIPTSQPLASRLSPLASRRIPSSKEHPPLSFAQQRLWFLDRLEPGNPAYNVPTVFEISGPLDGAALERSLSEIIRRHEALRTTFAEVDGEPVQIIAPVSDGKSFISPLTTVNLDHLPKTEREAEARRRIDEEARRPFDLSRGPLIRAILLKLTDTEHIFILVMHHIVSDGWSMGVFLRELGILYNTFASGKAFHSLPDLSLQYADFAVHQRERLQGEVLEKQLAYWKRRLADLPPVLELPSDHPRPPVQTFRGASRFFSLSADQTEALKALSRQEGATLFMTLLAALNVLLCRYTNRTDIPTGVPIANRNRREIEELIGFFVNTLVLRVGLHGDPTFRELLKRVREVTLEAYTYQDIPFERLVGELRPKRELSCQPLFQVMFVLENAPMEYPELTGLKLKPLKVDNGTAKFDLTLIMEEDQKALQGTWVYSTDLFESATISNMAEHFQTLLKGIISNPDLRVSELPLLTEAEQRRLLTQWNDTKTDYPRNRCVQELFEAQAERTPDEVAVVFKEERLTYRELNRRANQVAHCLRRRGSGPERCVGICMERCAELIVGLLGILKSGAAYVPLDAGLPKDRLAFMLEEAQVSILLTQQGLANKFSDLGVRPICMDADQEVIGRESEENPLPLTVPENMAYVLYTSGSTGKPKSVVIEHRSILNLLTGLDRSIYDAFHGTRLRISLNGPLFFDTSVKQWIQLLKGHTLCIIPSEVRFDGEALLGYLKRREADVLDCTPSQLELLIESGLLSPAAYKPRLVLVAGEPIDKATWKLLAQTEEIAFFNLYGPTECTVDTTVTRIRPTMDKPTIGRPIANVHIYLLDSHFRLVPPGMPGELYIGGDGLARGYFSRPDLTAERFIPHPFSDQPGARLYRSGDLARCLPDGNIEFLGRVDHQVKIRGFRIELGEIESVLEEHPAVREAVVVVREDSPGNKRLAAYLVLRKQSPPPSTDLLDYLRTKLPEYMLPSAFKFLDALPLMPNGKVNRRALPAPDEVRYELAPTYSAPRDLQELELTRLWEELLKVRPIGIRDNFFDLGGHSLLAVRLMGRIRQQFGQDISITTLFQGATIESLAEVLRRRGGPPHRSPLIGIQPSGSKKPFFCVHPIGGNVFCYVALARHLGSDQPFYGLQALGFEGDREPLTTIGNMAAHYIEAIRTVQPEGPYLLGGWSMGGVVAFEMARQLRREGHETDLLVLMDSSAPGRRKKLPDEEDDFELLIAFMKELGGSSAPNAFMSSADFRRLPPEERFRCLLERAKTAALLPPDTEPSQIRSLFRVFKANIHAVSDYMPEPHSCRIILFRAVEEGPPDVPQIALGWDAFCDRPVEICPVPGNHYTMLSVPNVRVLAEQLKTCLDQSGLHEQGKAKGEVK